MCPPTGRVYGCPGGTCRCSRFTQTRHPRSRVAPEDVQVAAAPLVFDDAPIASPELALVDADLAAQLRADLPTDEVFRPRHAPRPEYPALSFDAVVVDLEEEQAEEPSVGEPEAVLDVESSEDGEDLVV